MKNKKYISRYALRLLVAFLVFALLVSCRIVPPVPVTPIVTHSYIYYVATDGIDSNSGTKAQPWKTIQKCLDRVQPGDTCLILDGTYSESLTLKTSGTQTAPITLQCVTNKGCTVNSGNSKTISTSGKSVHYYIIDGLRLLSSFSPRNAASNSDASLDLAGVWGGYYDTNAGNNGFAIRNCYVEGALLFYGHNNLVENCEFNGIGGRWMNGIMDRYAASHDNIYRNNIIYDYGNRGIWSLQATDAILIEGNTIRDSGKNIDADGAGIPCTRHTIRNNVFIGGDGIQLENLFDSLVEGNIIRPSGKGIHVSGNGNGPDWFTEGNIEYRHLDTHTIIRNNIIFGGTEEGVLSTGQAGVTFVNNTIYFAKNPDGYYSGLDLSTYPVGNIYPSNNWTIKNNLIINQNAILVDISTSGLKFSHNFYGANSRFIFKDGSKSTSVFTTKTFAQWQYNTASLIGAPLFKSIDPNSADFLHLQSGSVLCTSGEKGSYIGAYACD